MILFYIDQNRSIPNVTVVKKVGNPKSKGFKDLATELAMDECFFVASKPSYGNLVVVIGNAIAGDGINNPADWDKLNRTLDEFAFPAFSANDALIADTPLMATLPAADGAIAITGAFRDQDGRTVRKILGWAINGDGSPAIEAAEFFTTMLDKARNLRAEAAKYDVIEVKGVKIIIDAETKIPAGNWEYTVCQFTGARDVVDIKTGRRLSNVISGSATWEQTQVYPNHDLGGYLDFRRHRLALVDQRTTFSINLTKSEFEAMSAKYPDLGRAVAGALL